ncbi:MAG: SDR family NAD(P)-dependent oxidoreductase [Acidimicrobiia bacterium]|nr:SDR family NAD(P)-dependent oxidoreductase [Acidimicrobiia bacterium]
MASPVPFDLPADALTGKVVVVTGASRGLGAGLAVRFAAHGASLGLCARTKPQPPAGSAAVCAVVDVTDPTAVEGFAGAVTATLGPIDLWVNNAGVLDPMGPQRDHDSSEVDRALLVNIGGVANGTRTFTRRARSWPRGRRVLVNITSGAARSTYAGWSIYGATKAAVDHFTETVGVEEPDIVCHAVAPGVVETDMQVAVRATDEATFPAVDRFRQIHADGAANTPAWVADHLAALVTGTLTPEGCVYRVPAEHP